jgi:ubiquinone/menaquinone biosynthesis C-methylase UbiE
MQEKLYNELANYYDLFCFNDYKKQIKFLLNIVRKFKTKPHDKDIRILDLACGSGEHIKILRNNFIIDGVDGNDGMLRMARKKIPKIEY